MEWIDFFFNFSWYFGKVSRQASEDWLLSPGYPKGTYLVRQGEAAPDTYTLSVRDCDELRGYIVKHYKIYTQRDPQSAFQSYFITPRKRFRTLDELVNHYSGLFLLTCFYWLILTLFGDFFLFIFYFPKYCTVWKKKSTCKFDVILVHIHIRITIFCSEWKKIMLVKMFSL